MEPKALHYEFYIAGTPEQVWQALMLPAEVRKIFYGSELQSTFALNSPMKYVGPDPDGKEMVHIYGKVLDYQPNKRFVHSCIVGEAYRQGRPPLESRVSYELVPIGACTKLMLTHDQWTAGDPSYDLSAAGWWRTLCSIKTLVETGKSLDLPLH